ncbi:MAG: electron transport complex subunit RsxC, partial [Deltaproteobacteria bacterium]|nr:electron transport complex subunit RsxC [Deltaproteobacteria bacterium]
MHFWPRSPVRLPGRFPSFPHGIHPPEEKHLTKDLPIRRFPFAPFLVLMLAQHAGRPAKPVVREGQEVARGQPVAEADGFVSAPIHAPASGVVKKVGQALDVNGRMAPAIVLEPYPGSDQRVAWGTPKDPAALSPAELIAAIQHMGMVGLGA